MPRSELERHERKMALAAIGRILRAYWEHEEAQPVPEHLKTVSRP
jgi:hypothetical protein